MKSLTDNGVFDRRNHGRFEYLIELNKNIRECAPYFPNQELYEDFCRELAWIRIAFEAARTEIDLND